MSTPLQLSELTEAIEQGIKKTLPQEYWVVAEISECNCNSKGHCYLELIEKPEQSDTIIAKIRATIWAYNYRLINAYFKSTTNIDLQAGIKVLVKAGVEFHAIYGISLNITDIDPIYTIGEDEKQRRDIIIRLQNEGIADMNKDIELPLVPQKIAIISSPQAAGYQDFMNQLLKNRYNIAFYPTLFSAAMQGAEVEESIIKALDSIFLMESDFDVVVIIRGGGAKTDLRWFDNYRIASHIAQFPIPVITGIGHDKDQSITDMVAHTSLKTPTAVAEFLIGCGTDVLFQLQDLEQQLEFTYKNSLDQGKETLTNSTLQIQSVFQTIVLKTEAQLQYKKQILNSRVAIQIEKEFAKIQQSQQYISSSSQIIVHKHIGNLELVSQKLNNSATGILQSQNQELTLCETKILLHNPQHIFAKGYSITTDAKGKTITSITQVKQGDKLRTLVKDGEIMSNVL